MGSDSCSSYIYTEQLRLEDAGEELLLVAHLDSFEKVLETIVQSMRRILTSQKVCDVSSRTLELEPHGEACHRPFEENSEEILKSDDFRRSSVEAF